MDAAYLQLIVFELQRTLCGATVTHVSARDQRTVLLGLRVRGTRRDLLASANPATPCLYLLSEPAAGLESETQPPFVQSMRRLLHSAHLEAIEQPPWDRLVRLRFASARNGHTLQRIELIVELTGRNSNLLLVGPDDQRILDCLRSVTSAQSRVRRIVRGERYQPLPGFTRPTLDQLEAASFASAWNHQETPSPAGRLKAVVAGLSPSMIREIVARAEAGGAWAENQASAVWKAAGEVRAALGGPAQPCVYRNPDGEALSLAPFPLIEPPAAVMEPFDSPSLAAERYVATLTTQKERRQRTDRLHAALRQALAREQRKLERLSADLQRCQETDGSGHLADILLAHLHELPHGAASVELPDWDDPEHPVSIQLDPQRTGAQNAEQYYQRQRKVTRAMPLLKGQEERCRQRIVALEEAQLRLQSATTMAEVQRWQESAIDQELLPTLTRQPQSTKARPGPKLGISHYRTPDGWEILVGAHSRGNDFLTTKVARDQDVWLHAHSVSGSHVVIRNPHKGKQVPAPVIEQAARLAVHFSKARNDSFAEVVVTSPRYVKKTKGAPPGRVSVLKHDTLSLQPQSSPSFPEPAFIERS